MHRQGSTKLHRKLVIIITYVRARYFKSGGAFFGQLFVVKAPVNSD